MTENIFFWQSENYDFLGFPVFCPWCASLLRTKDFAAYHETTTDRLHECLLCGWYFKKYIRYSESLSRFSGIYTYAILKKYNSEEIPFSLSNMELFLQKQMPTERQWSEKKIDEFIGGVMKNEGITIVFKIMALDRQRIILFVENKGQFYVLELFKSPNQPGIGMRFVHELIGLHLVWGRAKAYLVTETDPIFEPNIIDMNYKKLKKSGYRTDFKSAFEIMAALGLYNRRFPALHELSASRRQEIIETNKKTEIEWPIRRRT